MKTLLIMALCLALAAGCCLYLFGQITGESKAADRADYADIVTAMQIARAK